MMSFLRRTDEEKATAKRVRDERRAAFRARLDAERARRRPPKEETAHLLPDEQIQEEFTAKPYQNRLTLTDRRALILTGRDTLEAAIPYASISAVGRAKREATWLTPGVAHGDIAIQAGGKEYLVYAAAADRERIINIVSARSGTSAPDLADADRAG